MSNSENIKQQIADMERQLAELQAMKERIISFS